jgi:hypothetical protein
MRVAQGVAEILSKHVVLEVEGIDRMYLNVYVPRLQIIEGVLGFLKNHLGHKVASTKLVEPISRKFVAAIEQFVRDHTIPMICFDKGQCKDEVAARFRAGFSTALVKQYYFYCVDQNFGPFFLKVCSYFPYNAKLCLNGHEYVKCQLDQDGIAYESLDSSRLKISSAWSQKLRDSTFFGGASLRCRRFSRRAD